MNTIFESPEHYKAFRAAWKAACRNPDIKLKAQDYALYALLHGRSLDTQFPPITNPVKLANGQSRKGAQDRAVLELDCCGKYSLGPYMGTITLDMLRAVIRQYRYPDHE